MDKFVKPKDSISDKLDSQVQLASSTRGFLSATPELNNPGELLPSGSEELAKLLKSILEWAVELLGVEAGEVYLYDIHTRELGLKVVCGSMEKYYGSILQPGEGLAGKVFATGESILVDDYNHWNGRALRFNDPNPFQTELGMPLKWQERIIGVLVIVSDSRKRKLIQADIRPTQLCANLVAVAIENAQLYQEMHNSLRQLRRTLEQEVTERTKEIAQQTTNVSKESLVGNDASSELNTEELLARVVELRIAKKVLAQITLVPLELPTLQDLTPREIQILSLIGQGYSNKEIALELKLAVSTVKFHVGSILNKLSLPDRTQAALWSVRTGLVKQKSDET